MVDLANWIIPIVLMAGLGLSGRGMWNAWRRLHSVSRVLRERRRVRPGSDDDHLAIFDEDELRQLTQVRKGATIPGTRISDPWQAGLHLSSERLAINANALRFKADSWQATLDILIVIASVFAGVYATDFIQTFTLPGTPRMGWWAFSTSVAVLVLATISRVWVIPTWRSSAEKYRELALRSRRSRVRPMMRLSRRRVFPRMPSR